MIDFKDFKGVDATSEYSMDSAYQSQSGSSRQGRAYQSSPIQEHATNTFMTQGISPSLDADSFVPFSESHDLHRVPTTGTLDFGNGSQWFTNSSSAQDYTTYSPSMAPAMQPSSMATGFTWGSNDASYGYLPSYNETEFFRAQPSPQHQLSRSRVETSARPTSYFAAERTYSHASAHSSTGRASVVSPPPMQPLHSQSFTETSFEPQHLVGLGYGSSPSLLDLYIDRQNSFVDDAAQTNSPSEEFTIEDNEELKNMEEEHHKVARSHVLYSKEPGPDGLYHCPSEGESGCNHKPTSLKCNYE